jgi:DNA-binding transcriptional MerR regulator
MDVPENPVDNRRNGKSDAAFRTISEVATELGLPQHVLRFWESKFPQIRPLKRGGNRRYYRPEDVKLLSGIRDLLHNDGYTIKGVQKLLRENGPKSVTAEPPKDLAAEQAARAPEHLPPPAVAPAPAAPAGPKRADLEGILKELQELHDLLREA